MGELIVRSNIAGLGIEDDLRASHADRDKVAEHLSRALSEGRISEEIHQRRLQALDQTVLNRDLGVLTSDLPAPPRTRAEIKATAKPHICAKDTWVDGMLTVGFLCGVGGIITGIMGIALLDHAHQGDHGQAITCVVVGVVLFLAGLIGFANAISDN